MTDYPMIHNWLDFYYRPETNTYVATVFCTGESEELDARLAEFAMQLDGDTYPGDICPQLPEMEIDAMLAELERRNLLRKSMSFKDGFGSFCHTLFIPKSRNTEMRPARVAAFFGNLLLLISFLPVLAYGIYCLLQNPPETDFMVPGMIAGMLIGMVLHECAHAMCAVAYGAPVYEMGCMLCYFIIPGAYVLLDIEPVKRRLRKAQILAAGVEMNFLLTGLFLAAIPFSGRLEGAFLGAAVANGVLGLINLSLVSGIDGEAVLSHLIGEERLLEFSFEALFNSRRRKRLTKNGANGYALLTVSGIMLAFQLAQLLILAVNVVGVIVWLKTR